MRDKEFVLRDIDYDDRAIASIGTIENPYEVNYIQNPYDCCSSCNYNRLQQNYIEEMRY